MATEVANFSAASVRSYATQSLEKIALDTKIFVSMPYIGNLFLALRGREWEDDPSRVTILTPSVNNCIEGITRDW